MTPNEALNRLEFYDILCLQNVARGGGKLNSESLRDLENLGLVIEIDGKYYTTTLGSKALNLASRKGQK
ncbi:hypothetical protein H7347_07360 [Corynebacterium sp. zg-331]|uniref:hypothetical protein n=1 Tax=unclassified Corynebacterium TaxID=2624378 RepID=UPI00128C2E89|nr:MULTISPECIES: hypothetical protein [unclassified Corynebacterium]MBC3186391.1 hypothetical protein [Corynebacterium sp. zg-331]MPV52878.1 hypothetical protein [Corynebacterium sp. zg331]